MLAPARGAEHAVAVRVQVGLADHVAGVVVVLLELVDAAHLHGLAIGVQIALEDEAAVFVVALFHDNNAGLVGPDLAADVIIRLADHVPGLVVDPIDAVVVAAVGAPLALGVEIALRDLAVAGVVAVLHPGPAARAIHGRAEAVQAGVDGDVSVCVVLEGLAAGAQPGVEHRRAAAVVVHGLGDLLVGVELALDGDDAVLVGGGRQLGVEVGLPGHVARLVVAALHLAVAALDHAARAARVEVGLLDAAVALVILILRLRPAAHARHGVALGVQPHVDGYVAVLIVLKGFAVGAQLFVEHGIPLGVQIAHHGHAVCFIIFTGHGVHAVLVGHGIELVVQPRLADHIAPLVVLQGVPGEAVRAHGQRAAVNLVILLDQLVVVGKQLLDLTLRIPRLTEQHEAQKGGDD